MVNNDPQPYAIGFSQSVAEFFRDAARLKWRNPAAAAFIVQTAAHQQRAVQRRAHWESLGIHVPPAIILSVTHRCNLQCKGCYAHAQHRPADEELSLERMDRLLTEAHDLGVSIVVLAGGEPLTRTGVLDVAAGHPAIIFPMFTNGLLLDDATVEALARARNIIPVLSIEGGQAETDARRGPGVYARLQSAMERLRRRGVLFGASLTLTRSNFDAATDRAFTAGLHDQGARVFFWLDYVPIQCGTDDLTLTPELVEREKVLLADYRRDLAALFVGFPSDEEVWGGCLASGRGFVHISPSGALEPCPASPVSDASVADGTLREALASPLLRALRESGLQHEEGRGGCALWDKREQVAELVASLAAPGHAPSP